MWSDAERRRTKRIFKNAPSLHEAMLLAEKCEKSNYKTATAIL